MKKEKDIKLTGKKREDAIAILKKTPFENLVVDEHYFKKNGSPRHGISLNDAKEIYNQTDKIILVSYRNSRAGRKYAFIYKISKKNSYYLLFFLDRKRPCLFNAYRSDINIEQRLLKKFGFKR
ncbi:hypothetical protein CMI42_01275 [Candidatus Pacearchaeota archaeon]|nr:hypothetical protein [Candidatus Pacearchaeota archaeon]|tara:strand:- start:2469 stop:2837 length:369 start_codon:yes stop_codon:yes gene_type:complete